MAKKLGIDLFGSNAVLSHGLSIGSSYKSQVKVNRYHTTLSPISIDTTLQVLIINGGGSGGGGYAGGGGCGGQIALGTFSLSTHHTYDIIVGAGGIYDSANQIPTFGGLSSFAGNTTGSFQGAGYGGQDENYPSENGGGGCGQIGGTDPYTGGAYFDGNGNVKGGDGFWDEAQQGFDTSGGGGAGQVSGQDATPNANGGVGGNGFMTSHFFPDIGTSILDYGIGCGGGGGKTSTYPPYGGGNYSQGGSFGGSAGGVYYGGRGGANSLVSLFPYKAPQSGSSQISYPAGSGQGFGNGGGGGAYNINSPNNVGAGGNGSDGAVILKVPANFPWDQNATNNANPDILVGDPVNDYIYIVYPTSGTFIML